MNQRIPQLWGLRIEQLRGTRGTSTRDPVSWTGTVPAPTVPGTRHQVPGSQSDTTPGARFSVRRGTTLLCGAEALATVGQPLLTVLASHGLSDVTQQPGRTLHVEIVPIGYEPWFS